jgi:hypothetical protein
MSLFDAVMFVLVDFFCLVFCYVLSLNWFLLTSTDVIQHIFE